MLSIRMASRVVGLAASAFLFLNLPSATLLAGAPYERVFNSKSAIGEELANAFFDLLSATGSPAGTVGTTTEQNEASKALVSPHLDSAFQLQRASGERYTANTYLPADVDDFEIGDVRETRPADDVLVVRYSVRTTETLSDAALVMSKDKAPRLTVFHWNDSDKSWKILSHANFNTPLAAVCDNDPLVDNGLQSSVSADDQKLGSDLAEKWLTLLQQGNSRTMLNPKAQGQGAGGIGFTTIAEYKEPKFSKIQFEDVVVTRNEELIVVSLYAEAVYRLTQETGVISNVTTPSLPLTEEVTPRLFTFLQSEDKRWSLIATAIFNPPKELPQGAVCVPAGKLEDAPL